MLDTDAASKLLGEYNDRTSEINRQIEAIIKADETGRKEAEGQLEIGEEAEVKSKWGQAIQGLETYSREEIKSIVLKHIEDILSERY